MLSKSVQQWVLWIGKSLISAAQGNKNITTSVESVCWLNTDRKQSKEFLLFGGFYSVTPSTLFSVSLLHTPILKGIIKQGRPKPWHFLTVTISKQKQFCCSVTVSLSPIQSYVLSLKLPRQRQRGNFKIHWFYLHLFLLNQQVFSLLTLPKYYIL